MKLKKEYEAFLAKYSIDLNDILIWDDEMASIFRRAHDEFPLIEKMDEIYNKQKLPPRDEINLENSTSIYYSGQKGMEKLLKTAKTPFELITHGLAFSAEQALKYSGYDIDFDYYAGEFPTGEVNACAVSVNGGYLFLFNHGLIMFLGKLSKLITHSISATNIDSNGKAIIDDKFMPGALKFKESAQLIKELLLDYLRYGSPFESRKIPHFTVNEYEMMKFREGNLSRMEQFIMLHEFSHAVLGHLKSNSINNLITPSGEVPALKKSWQQEFQADTLAVKILLDNASQDGHNLNSAGEMAMAGAIIGSVSHFLCIVDALETIIVQKTGQSGASSTHPSAIDRITNIYGYLYSTFGAEPFKILPGYKHVMTWYMNLLKPEMLG